MEIKDVKIGDKVQLRKDIPDEELAEILGSHCLTIDNALELQRRGEAIVESIQYQDPDNDWDSITLVDSNFYWPIEIFEPASNTNKGKKEQVQEDILILKGIAERYGIQYSMKGIIEWLRDFGQKYLQRD